MGQDAMIFVLWMLGFILFFNYLFFDEKKSFILFLFIYLFIYLYL